MTGRREVLMVFMISVTASIKLAECSVTNISIQEGDNITLELPGFHQCGQYILLDPSLELVIIVSGVNSTTTFGSYIIRSVLVPTTSGFNLTIGPATKEDEGTYKLAVSTKPICSEAVYDVTVHTGAVEYLRPWSEWSGCIMECDPESVMYRERNCSVPGGCSGLGNVLEEDTCDNAKQCPHWTEWSQYGACSARCGKGFKIRKRICIDNSDTLRDNAACFGHSTENNICMVICDIVGVWSDWSTWGNCTGHCDNGSRIRTRNCGGDPRATLSDCPGSGNETKHCVPEDCPHPTTSLSPTSPDSSTNTSVGLPAFITISNDVTLNFYVLIAMGCIVLIIIVLITVCVMRKRTVRRRSMRDIHAIAKSQNTPKPGKDGKVDAQPKTRSNVYSEMNTSTVENEPEVNTRDPNDPTRSPRLPTTSAILRDLESEILNGSYASDDPDSDFDIDGSVRSSQCERQEVFVMMPEKRSFSITSETASILGVNNIRRGSSLRRPSDVMRAKKYVQFHDNVIFEKEIVEAPEGDVGSPGDVVTPNEATEQVVKEKLSEVLAVIPDTSKAVTMSESEQKRISRDIDEVMDNIGYPREIVYQNATVVIDDLMQPNVYKKSGRVFKKQESVYNSPVIALCNCPRDAKPPRFQTPNGTLREMKAKEAMQEQQQQHQLQQQQLGGENTYYNEKVASDIKDFYVTPKRKRSLRLFKKNSDEEPIYDVPKFSDT